MATATFTDSWGKSSGPVTQFKQLHDALIAVGLAQTTDTGQLDLTTSPTFTTGSAYVYGYTIYKWTDAAQTTYPLFMRITWRNITYASGSTGTAWQGPVITVGTGTDGAGTITGTLATGSTKSTSLDTTSSTLYASTVCYFQGALVMSLAQTAGTGITTVRNFIAVDRLRALDGTIASGAWVSSVPAMDNTLTDRYRSLSRTSIATYAHATAPSTSNVPTVGLPYPWFSEASVTTGGTNTPFFPPYILEPEARTVLCQVVVPTADVGYDNTIKVSRFGSLRTYKSLGTYSPSITTWGGTNFSIAYLCE